MYYVHWNTVVRKIKIHRSECGACNNGAGMHKGRIDAGRGETYDWVKAQDYNGALRVAEDLQFKKPILKRGAGKWDCGLCRPARSQ